MNFLQGWFCACCAARVRRADWAGVLLLLLFAAFLVRIGPAAAQSDTEYYKEPGVYPNRDYVNQHFAEHIDPFTGRLQLHYVDLHIPGNGGFDLKIARSYTSVDDDANPLAEPAPFGYGWTMHFGRVLRKSTIPLCTSNYVTGREMPVLELPDGSRHILFRDDYSVFSGTGRLITNQRWRAECMGGGTGLRVFSPEGIQYEMNQFGAAPFSKHAWYTTRISDRNGNWMSIGYIDLGGTVIVPGTITTSDGRIAYFDYTGSGYQAHLTAVRHGTRTWQYQYKQVGGAWLLTDVIRPAAGTWSYGYKEVQDGSAGLYSIRTAMHPQEGTVTYGYGFVHFVPGYVRNAAVTQKTVSTGGTWGFAYIPSTGFGTNDQTTVTTPNGTITYQHVGYVTVGGGEYWKVGLLAQKQIGTEQTESYTWTAQTISAQDNLRPGSTLGADAQARAPVLSQKLVVRDGNTYTTAYSDFDAYGNPQTVTETAHCLGVTDCVLSSGPTGPIGGAPPDYSRTTALTYQTNTSLWLIHQVKDESFDGFSITRQIDPRGNVTQENRYGVRTDYEYDTQGNLSARINARGFRTAFFDYFRGIPRTENHPEGVSIARTVSDAGNVLTERDGKGDTMGYGYDGLNRLNAIDYPRVGAADASILWTATTMTLTRGTFRQVVSYDGFGRIRSVAKTDTVSPSQNATVDFQYDPLGRRTFQSYPNATIGTNFTYDLLDRVKTTTHGDGTQRIHTYNAHSVAVRNERAHTHKFYFRAYGDPDKRELMGIAVPTPNANVIIARNPIGRITGVTQGARTRTYGYDSVTHFLTSIIDPETGTTSFGRDAVGNMTSRRVGASALTNYSYDGLDRLTTTDYPGVTPDVSKTYYGDGLLKDAGNSVAARYFEYDADKNLSLERLTVDGVTYDIRHTYELPPKFRPPGVMV